MTTKNDKLGFSGQWIDIFTTGTHTDNKGEQHKIDHAFLEQVVSNFKPELHEPPAVIGHPETDAPAYAWVCAVRVDQQADGEVLQAQFCNSDPAFEQLVEDGKFKKRSSAFYMDTQTAPGGRVPSLRHVGFLGAQPPAVKGLREIKFGEGEAVTFDLTFSEGDSSMDKKDLETVTDGLWEKVKAAFGIGAEKPGATQPAYSEAEIDARIKKATETMTAAFNEKFTTLEEENKSLKERLDNHSGSATRTEIVSFCERVGAGRLLPAFKRMGVIEFMETLATVPEKKVAVIAFAEEGGKEVEKKMELSPLQFFQSFLQSLPPFIEFGEKLGNLKVESAQVEMPDGEGKAGLRKGMGVTDTKGGDK
jgi:hypothetical protein